MVKLHIIWGENPEHGEEPVEYELASTAEAAAFLRGANEAIGWGDLTVTEGPDYRWDDEADEAVPTADWVSK